MPGDRTTTLKQLRKVGILILGTAIIVFAILIAPLPGPGFTLIAPVGAAMLASEFYWAKRLIDHLRHRTGWLERHVDVWARNRSRWMAPIIGFGYWAIVFALGLNGWPTHRWVFPLAGVVFAPLSYWLWRVWATNGPPTRPAPQPRQPS